MKLGGVLGLTIYGIMIECLKLHYLTNFASFILNIQAHAKNVQFHGKIPNGHHHFIHGSHPLVQELQITQKFGGSLEIF